MKKRMMPALLVLCMVLTLLPAKAQAEEEKAPAPTNLTWDDKGNLSFNASEKCDLWNYNIYRDGEKIAHRSMKTQFLPGEEGTVRFHSSNLIDKSGKYTIEICLCYPSGNEFGETFYYSEWVMSEPFEYTHPGTSLQLPTNFSIDKDYIPTWTVNDFNLNYPGTYEINLYFKPNGKDEWLDCASQSILFEHKRGGDFFQTVLLGHYQDGYSGPYGATIRAVSGNINWIGHSEESEMMIFNYDGSLAPTPSKTPLAKSMFTVDTAPETYDGTAKTKAIISSLTEGTDYTVSYSNNVDVGAATITITGKGDYSGTLTYTFEIKQKETLHFSIARKSVTLIDGNVAKPKITVLPEEATVSWSSSDPAIVAIDSNGTITGMGEGNVVITGTASYRGQEKTESYTVSVRPRVGITLICSEVVAPMPNQKYKLHFGYSPLDATITVSTSNPSVADVTYSAQTGAYIIPKGSGSAVVTVTVEKDGKSKSASCTVTVPTSESEEEIIQCFVNTAKNQNGNGPGAFGWTDSWCAKFVYWCAEKAGVSTIIPTGGGAAADVCGKVVQENGKAVYFDDATIYNDPVFANNSLVKNAKKVNRNSYIPQVGDIVFFDKV